MRYVHLVRTSIRCCSSVISSSDVEQTVLALYVMVTIPLKLLVCVCGLSIYTYGQGSVSFLSGGGIQKGH